MEESARMLEQQRENRGGWSTGEKSTVVAFGVTVLLWVLRGILANCLWRQQSGVQGAYGKGA